MPSKIRKRDGRIVAFEPSKIAIAIGKAFKAVGEEDGEVAARLAEEVVNLIDTRIKGTPGVEDVQDTVEETLIKHGHAKVAKAYILYRQKRAELREAKRFMGVVDDLKLGINAIKVLEKRYLLRDENLKVIETPSMMFRRVARAIAAVDRHYNPGRDVKKVEEEFYSLMANLEFLPNSPTLMNAGTDVGQLSACFVIPIFDSVEDIFNALKYMALIHQSGGGTGFSFSRIRPRGDIVKSTKGVASGPLSFMRAFDMATEIIKQGGKRRGANMGILRVDHPDILEFIPAKGEEGLLTNFNVSVAVTDDFMRAVEEDKRYPLVNPRNSEVVKKLRARDVFDLIVTSAWRTGDPGLIFIDEINRHNPTPHLGEIESTNPCLAAGSLITTNRGLMKIEDIAASVSYDESLNVFIDTRACFRDRGSEEGGSSMLLGARLGRLQGAWFSGVKDTVKITTKRGYEVICTPDHRFLTSEGGWVAAQELLGETILLQSGECVYKAPPTLPMEPQKEYRKDFQYELPRKWSRDLGRVLGWLVGDGWLSDTPNYRVGFTFNEDDVEYMEIISSIIESWSGRRVKPIRRANNVWHLSYHSKTLLEFFKALGCACTISKKKRIPERLFTAPREAVEGFLEYLFLADGTASINQEKGVYIRLTYASKGLLRDVQNILLGTFGIKSSIYERKRAVTPFRYTDVHGNQREYISAASYYELNLSGQDLEKFFEVTKLGGRFTELREVLSKMTRGPHRKKFEDEVISVEPNGKAPVYDIAEGLSSTFLANGIVVHNCAEQPLLPYESCNLGSINLARMISREKGGAVVNFEKLGGVVKTAVHFLDNVIDANRYPLKEIKRITKGNRKIGLGVMGFAQALLELGIPYDSEEALNKADEIMGFITKTARKASMELAEERGSFPNYKGSVWEKRGIKVRNASITTIAPTGTLSIIASTSSGIEPIFAVSFYRSVMGGTRLLEVNPVFERIARERGFYSKELLREIARVGSIQGVKEIPRDVRRLFVTALDIAPEWHVRMQAVFQKHVDSAVSKTVNLPNDATLEDVKKVYMRAYKLKCKGITIYRYGSKREQVLYIGPVSEAEGKGGDECLGRHPSEECPL